MEVSHNHNAKSQLAKLLATENITVQHKPDAKTAWFDVKNRILCLPVWREMSEDLYDMLVVHEVGHALDTPGEDFVEKIKAIAARLGETSNRAIGAIKGFLNVIEDARIDKRQKRRFPGARRNYIKGYKELIDRDFFGTLTKDVNAMSFIDRLNIYCKGGVMLGIKFSPEEKIMLRKVEDAETFEEVLALTEEIYAWSKKQMDEKTEDEEDGNDMRQKSASGLSEDGDEYEFGDESETDDTDEDHTDASSKSSYDEDGDEDEDELEADGSADTDSDEKEDDGAAGGTAGDDIPESETEKAWQKKQEDLIINSEYEYIYAKLPKLVNYDLTVHDYKIVLADHNRELARSRYGKDWLDTVRQELVRFKSSENAAISFMVKEFEMRKSADEYSRTSVSKTGTLDTNKLHSYRYNDDLFRRITTVATGKNHGFVMFVDWSGSMDSNLRKTVRQLISLVMFCKRVQIPFEVYSFRSVTGGDTDRVRATPTFTRNNGELDMAGFVARNMLSSRMRISELNEAMYHLFIMSARGGSFYTDQLTSTPLNPCIAAAAEIVNRFKVKSKVQVVNTVFLTDGDSDPLDGTVYGLGYGVYGKTKKYIIQDDITKKSYELPATRFASNTFSNNNITPILLKILKERTGCNLIGFFINSSGFKRVYDRYHYGAAVKHHEASKKSWNDNGFFGVTSAGYDEYYILNAMTFNVSSGKLKVDANATKRKLVSEFIKFSENKSVSRVLLSQIVKRIAA